MKENNAIERFRVPHERLTCPAFSFNFETTEELEPLAPHVFIGQPRAEAAIRSGLDPNRHDNIFVVGNGTISSVLLERLRMEAAELMGGKKINDVVCVHNFEQPGKHRFMRLEKGRGRKLERDMEKLLASLRDRVPKELASEEFKRARAEIEGQVKAQTKEQMEALAAQMNNEDVDTGYLGAVSFAYSMHNMLVSIFPVIKAINRALTPEEFGNLEEHERQKIEEMRERFASQIEEFLGDARGRDRQMDEEISQLKRQTVSKFFREKAAGVMDEYGEAVVEFMEGLHEYTLQNLDIFLPQENGPAGHPAQNGIDPTIPFKINVFVNNAKTEGVPVVEHRNTDFERLFGKAGRYHLSMGGFAPATHMDVAAGLISEADGGLLVLSANDIFKLSFSKAGIWEKLRGVLETRRLDIGHSDSPLFDSGQISPETLNVDVKLVLVADQSIYRQMLSFAKDEFDEIFKTVVMLDWEASRTEAITSELASLLSLFCKTEGFPPLSRDGVGEMLRHASRRVADQEKFSLDFRWWKDLLSESVSVARNDALSSGKSALVSGENVKEAVSRREYRLDLVREKVHAPAQDGSLLLSLGGSEVGQANGISYIGLQDLPFGRPVRVTARTFAGQGGIISIDRGANLSGSAHDKGVLTLAGYLGGKYGQERPLSLSATLSFEQTHGVDGDSASSTELYALLSSLSEAPLRQDIAVSGSVNQRGEIQPVGGLNEKIEGFFDICSFGGLSGSQGVMIPHQNVKNLILRHDVAEAVREGKFHIYAITTIDEGMEILSGQEMGERISGEYPVLSINGRIERKLLNLAKASAARNNRRSEAN